MNYNDLKEFGQLIQRLCLRPAMYVGRADYDLATSWLSAYDSGWARGKSKYRDGLHLNTVFFEKFRDFLEDEFGVMNRQFNWASNIKVKAEEGGDDPFKLLATLFADFVIAETPPLVQLADEAE